LPPLAGVLPFGPRKDAAVAPGISSAFEWLANLPPRRIAGLLLLFAKVLNVMKGMRSWAFEFMEFPLRIYIYYMPYLLFMPAAKGVPKRGGKSANRRADKTHFPLMSESE